MSNIEKLDARDLIRQAREEGLLDSNMTINCLHCPAVFPKEYLCCPQCGIKIIYHLM